jgi:hypothetical protein
MAWSYSRAPSPGTGGCTAPSSAETRDPAATGRYRAASPHCAPGSPTCGVSCPVRSACAGPLPPARRLGRCFGSGGRSAACLDSRARVDRKSGRREGPNPETVVGRLALANREGALPCLHVGNVQTCELRTPERRSRTAAAAGAHPEARRERRRRAPARTLPSQAAAGPSGAAPRFRPWPAPGARGRRPPRRVGGPSGAGGCDPPAGRRSPH